MVSELRRPDRALHFILDGHGDLMLTMIPCRQIQAICTLARIRILRLTRIWHATKSGGFRLVEIVLRFQWRPNLFIVCARFLIII
jgi:hypothetical protein